MTEESKLFDTFLRYGLNGIPKEQRAQSVATDTAGGFLVAAEFSDTLYAMLKQADPLFDPDIVTMVTTATGAAFSIPLVDDTAGLAEIISENSISTIADVGAFDQIVLAKAPTWRSNLVKASMELVQDAAFDLSELLAQLFAERFRRGIGASLVTTITAGATLGVTAGATVLVADNIYDLFASVDPAYIASTKCGWLMRHATLVAIRKLSVGPGDVKIFPPERDADRRPLLLDLPVFICPSVPAIGTGNKSVLFGDIGRLIVRRVANSVRVRRLDERYISEGALGFHAYMRTNAGLAKATGSDSPVKYLQHA